MDDLHEYAQLGFEVRRICSVCNEPVAVVNLATGEPRARDFIHVFGMTYCILCWHACGWRVGNSLGEVCGVFPVTYSVMGVN